MRRSPASGTASLTLDASVVTRGAELLHAQCWLWGQDLRSPRGNLLQACGLEGSVFEGARSHRRFYRARPRDGQFVVAWSGGLLYGSGAGAHFLPRLKFVPRWLADVRSLDAVPNLNAISPDSGPLPAESDALLIAALDWLAAYEDAAIGRAGHAWRARCADLWVETEAGARAVASSVGVRYQPLPPLPEDGLAKSWRALRSRITGR